MSQLHNSVLDLARARIGQVVCGKWRVEKLLGLGGMAAVYGATHVKNGARVALKMLHPQLSMNEEVRKRFAREGYVGNTVGHPGVPRVLDDDTAEDGSVFLVMDLLEGETADQRATRTGGKLSAQDVAGIGDAILDVLAAAHARGIIHRDIKPENVFLTTDQRVILLDFGIARVIDASASTTETRNGAMMGTPAFMPPEQARGRANEMDATSDVWAVGATLFYLLAGRVVHPADTANEQLVAAATLPAASLAQVASGIPTPLVDVIDRSLEYTKSNRYPDARAMQQALRDAIEAISWGGKLPPGFNLARPPTPAIPIPISPGPTSDALPLSVQQRQAPTEISVRLPPDDSARNPTLGPMVMADPPRSRTRMALAIAVGTVSALLVLGAVFIAFRGAPSSAAASASLPEIQPAKPVVTIPSVVASATATAIATVSTPPTVVVSALPAASSVAAPTATPRATQPRPATSTGKNTWLDRRN